MSSVYVARARSFNDALKRAHLQWPLFCREHDRMSSLILIACRIRAIVTMRT